jgi:hypothetical protein
MSSELKPKKEKRSRKSSQPHRKNCKSRTFEFQNPQHWKNKVMEKQSDLLKT